MLLRTSAFVLALLCFDGLTAGVSAASEWTPGDAGEGAGYAYRVFSAQREGEDFTRYEVRGFVAAEPTALSRAVRVITSDPERAPRGQTRRVLQADDETFVVHTLIDMPYPFGDLDIVTRGVRGPHGAGERIDWEATEHPAAPRSEEVTRIERSAGHWTFVTADGGRSEVVYHSYSDAGGFLPGWLVSSLTEANVASVFEDVAEEAMQSTQRAMALP